MKRSVQCAAGATFVALLISGGVGVAHAAPSAASDVGVESYSVPASDMATSTSWSSERMRAAIPADVLAADRFAHVDVDPSSVEVGSPSVVHGQAPNAGPRNGGGGQVELSETPVAHIGKVFFTLGGIDYVCSGNAVVSANESTVSTAGHCLNEGPGDYATEFVFVPAYENGNAPYGQWPATELLAPSQWVTSGDFNYDTAFAVVSSPTGLSLSDTVGASGVAFNQATGLTYSLYGYPAGRPFNGQSLESCFGTAVADSFNSSTAQGVPCDMTGGSSGGPWFIGDGAGGLQNSVNSFGYKRVKDTMWGPYWGDVIESTYQAAQA